jgi:hypothetical protein
LLRSASADIAWVPRDDSSDVVSTLNEERS